MNHKYRKKPVVIEAFQMTEERRRDTSEWPEWLHAAWKKDTDVPGSVQPKLLPYSGEKDILIIVTLEGNMGVGWDDFIIQGVQGELYTCKPDIFEATYEKVEEEEKT